jgi:ASC-1-like (ASCH) protein
VTVASVERVDAARKTVLLEGPHANYVEVKVKDPQVMKDVKAGDKVVVTHTEAVVVEIQAAARK